MTKAVMSVIVGLLGLIALTASAQPVATGNLNQQLTQLVNQSLQQYQLPALSVSIQLPNEDKPRNYAAGYFTSNRQRPITAQTIFQMGSLTKTFTATIILRLVEQGELALNDNLAKWLPQYPRWKQITITNLLTHTSGVYKVIDTPGYWQTLKQHPQQAWSLTQLADMAYQHPDYFQPGHGYRYSNTDYILLGLIIEKATQQPLPQLFNHYLSDDLHLTHSYYVFHGYPPATRQYLAHGYDDEGTFGYKKDVTAVGTFTGSPAGSVVATPNDMVKFIHQLFTGQLLSAQSLHRMQTLYSHQTGQRLELNKFLKQSLPSQRNWFDVGQGFGMGLVYLRGAGLVWMHAGGKPGYQSLFAYDPCSGIYMVLAYSKQPQQPFVFLKIAQTVFQTLNQSPDVAKQIALWQKTHQLPSYCQQKIH